MRLRSESIGRLRVAPPFTLSAITTMPKTGTHRQLLGRLDAEARTRPGYWLRLLVAVLLIPVVLFVGDQKVIAPLVWGSNWPTFRMVASDDYETASRAERTLVVAVGGMGVKDATLTVATPLVPAFVEHIPHSKLLALDEGTRLFLPRTYAAFDNAFAENPAATVVFYGMSAGTKEMLYLAAHLRATVASTRIILFADSGPLDAYSAYELRANPQLVGLGAASSRLHLFGGPITDSLVDINDSQTRRKYAGSSGSVSAEAFWSEVGRIGRDVWTRGGTPNSLRVGQLALIADDSAKSNMVAIADTDQPPVWFFYLAPGDDRTVDDNYAAAAYRSFAETINHGADYRFVKIDLPGLPHASERLYPDPYNQAIEKAFEMIDARTVSAS